MIARKAGTVVSLGILCGVISGCGTSLDPRLQPNANLRESCTYKGNTYSDEKIRSILSAIEERRLRGSTIDEQYDTVQATCKQQDLTFDEETQCLTCRSACVYWLYTGK